MICVCIRINVINTFYDVITVKVVVIINLINFKIKIFVPGNMASRRRHQTKLYLNIKFK